MGPGPPLTGRIAQAQAGGFGGGGAKPQAGFRPAGRGILSDVQSEIEGCLVKS
jgi:hypothetical protein